MASIEVVVKAFDDPKEFIANLKAFAEGQALIMALKLAKHDIRKHFGQSKWSDIEPIVSLIKPIDDIVKAYPTPRAFVEHLMDVEGPTSHAEEGMDQTDAGEDLERADAATGSKEESHEDEMLAEDPHQPEQVDEEPGSDAGSTDGVLISSRLPPTPLTLEELEQLNETEENHEGSMPMKELKQLDLIRLDCVARIGAMSRMFAVPMDDIVDLFEAIGRGWTVSPLLFDFGGVSNPCLAFFALSISFCADTSLKFLQMWTFFLIEMLAVTFDFTLALTSMGALSSLIGGFTHLRLVGINMDFSNLAIRMFEDFNIVFIDGIGFPSIFKDLFGWIAVLSGRLTELGIWLEGIFYEVPTLSRCRGLYGVVSLVALLALMVALVLTVNSTYMYDLKLKYAKINWEKEASRHPRLRNVYTTLHRFGKAGAKTWRLFTQAWYAGCHTSAAALFRVTQVVVLLFTTRVVELFRLFRETEFAESLGDSFVIPTMCGTGGDAEHRLASAPWRAQLVMGAYRNFSAYPGEGEVEYFASNFTDGVRDDVVYQADKVVAAFVWLIWMLFLSWPLLLFLMPMVFSAQDSEHWNLKHMIAPLTIEGGTPRNHKEWKAAARAKVRASQGKPIRLFMYFEPPQNVEDLQFGPWTYYLLPPRNKYARSNRTEAALLSAFRGSLLVARCKLSVIGSISNAAAGWVRLLRLG
eukprot:4501008-Prymnesium_polylepis.1